MSDEQAVEITTESTETSAPVGTEAPATQETSAQTPEEVAAQVAQAYAPSLKYKFLEQEKEFNPVFKELVKNAEIEKALKELHEKSDGLDFIKPKFHETREKLRATETQFTTVQKEIQSLGKMIEQGDLGKFFGAIKLPVNSVYQWVLNQVREQEMPPEQRAMLKQQREVQEQLAQKETVTQSQQAQIDTYAVQARTAQLELGLTRPDIRSFSEAFDAQVGRPGAFKQECIKQGKMAAFTSGEDLPVDQVIKQVMDNYGVFLHSGATVAKPTPGVVMPTANDEAQAEKPVIPNIQGKGGSPAKRTIKSIADLKRLAQQMAE